jgi:hypothetical protein
MIDSIVTFVLQLENSLDFIRSCHCDRGAREWLPRVLRISNDIARQ